MRLSSVVLPAPRKPVRMVLGINSIFRYPINVGRSAAENRGIMPEFADCHHRLRSRALPFV
jgi:hypothetical protein